jgi:hypothetical protein
VSSRRCRAQDPPRTSATPTVTIEWLQTRSTLGLEPPIPCSYPRPHPLSNAAGTARQPQPSSLMAQPAFQIFVMCRILSPAKSMT